MKRFVFSNCNGAKSAFPRIRAFLSIFTICTALFLAECLSEIKLYPFLSETESNIIGRGISAHFGRDGPVKLVKSTKFDIITTQWLPETQRNGEPTPIIITSCYRNQTTDNTQDFINEISTQIQDIKQQLVGDDPQIIVWGYFNCPAEQCMDLVNQIDGLFLLDSPAAHFDSTLRLQKLR